MKYYDHVIIAHARQIAVSRSRSNVHVSLSYNTGYCITLHLLRITS